LTHAVALIGIPLTAPFAFIRKSVLSATTNQTHRSSDGKAEDTAGNTPRRSDFVRDIVAADLGAGKYQGVVTRFPPEPNGFLHIGHAKSICLNFGIAQDFNGHCHLRMDDTDPTKEDVSYVNSIQEDIQWLGFAWGQTLYYASDYFDQFYACALQLIKEGKAYVDSLNEQEIREYRGTVTAAGKESPYRARSITENLDLFERMRAGAFPDGAHVLRAKADMANPNMKMRDPLLYRIRHAHHYRTGDKWCIYPMYDFAHPISDALEKITHSICTLEFENNRELYDWVLTQCGFQEPRPHQYEFARLNLNYAVMSKRKFLELVEKKFVSGWDDPRMPTISGLRRRGYTSEAIRQFCDDIGVAKANSTVDMAQLEFAIRDDLNRKVPRVLAVLHPLKVVIENYPAEKSETLDAALYPYDVPKEGSRALPFERELYIEQEDFLENPPAGYFRLTPGGEVRLRHAYIIKCEQVIKDASGQVIELRCSYDPQTRSGDSKAIERKVKGTIHWVPANHAKKMTVRLYDRLFNTESPSGPEDLNPHSLETITSAYVEPWVAEAEPGSRFQFERQGYFYLDPTDYKPGDKANQLVFNRIVSLKDSWAKAQKSDAAAKSAVPDKTGSAKTESAGSVKVAAKPDHSTGAKTATSAPLSAEQEQRANGYREQLKLTEEEARLIAADDTLSQFFEATVAKHDNPPAIANWIVNELLRKLKETSIAALPFGPKALAELVSLIDNGTISGKIAKELFADMLKSGGSPTALVEQKGLKQISNADELAPIVDKVLAANPDNVAKYKEGRSNLFGFFVGQVLKETQGRANPQLVTELVQAKLSQ
jgi:glutaminyl-tRNA synthetase